MAALSPKWRSASIGGRRGRRKWRFGAQSRRSGDGNNAKPFVNTNRQKRPKSAAIADDRFAPVHPPHFTEASMPQSNERPIADQTADRDALVAQYRRIGIAAVAAASPYVQMSQASAAVRQHGASGEKPQQQA